MKLLRIIGLGSLLWSLSLIWPHLYQPGLFVVVACLSVILLLMPDRKQKPDQPQPQHAPGLQLHRQVTRPMRPVV
jgi:hypothetical protein